MDEKKNWKWLATIISLITAGIAILTFLQGLVYTNAQGRMVEMKLAELETKVTEMGMVQRGDISHIQDKIDEIYKMLMRAERRD